MPSKIILNIIIPEIDSFIKTIFKSYNTSVSPIMSYESDISEKNNCFCYKILISRKEIFINIYSDGFSDALFFSFSTWLKNRFDNVRETLSLLCKKNISIEYIPKKDNLTKTEVSKKRIDISFLSSSGGERYLLLIVIPDDFFSQLLRKREIGEDPEKLEELISDFFMNPFNTFPNLKAILNSLNELDLQRLLYKLQKNNLLTTYQLCLLVRSFPEHALRIKKNISKNRISDVTDMLNKLSGAAKITKRDLIEGIYSIEEAIYMLMKKETDTGFSKILADIFLNLNKSADTKKILKKNFSIWIKEINDSGFLYQIISSMKEIEIARAISDRAGYYHKILKELVSKKR